MEMINEIEILEGIRSIFDEEDTKRVKGVLWLFDSEAIITFSNDKLCISFNKNIPPIESALIMQRLYENNYTVKISENFYFDKLGRMFFDSCDRFKYMRN